MSEPEHLNHDELLDVVRRLGQALGFVDHILTEDKAANQLWVVWGDGVNLGQCVPCGDVGALCAFINDLRARQNKDDGRRYWMHIFCGQRWQIQKGRVWQLWDGKALIPIEGHDTPPMIDDTGSLFECVDLDRVLPDNQAASPPADTSNEIRIGLQVIGQPGEDDDDDVAPEGEDPEIV